MILRFSGVLYEWRGPAPFHFVDVPEDDSAVIASIGQSLTYGWGAIPVIAQLGGTEWKTSLFPRGGVYALPVKDAVRRAEDATLGQVLDIRLTLNA